MFQFIAVMIIPLQYHHRICTFITCVVIMLFCIREMYVAVLEKCMY